MPWVHVGLKLEDEARELRAGGVQVAAAAGERCGAKQRCVSARVCMCVFACPCDRLPPSPSPAPGLAAESMNSLRNSSIPKLDCALAKNIGVTSPRSTAS